MAFKKKTWKDRLVEYAGRRQLKRISGDASGTMVVDVMRNEGTVSQAGDAFSAANMNDLEQRIADEFGELNNNLPQFMYDDTGKIIGYKTSGGADTVFPFSSKPICLGTGTKFDLSSYAGYQNFTEDNFIIEPQNVDTSTTKNVNSFSGGNRTAFVVVTAVKTYNADTGILTAYYSCRGGVSGVVDTYKFAEVKAYLVH